MKEWLRRWGAAGAVLALVGVAVYFVWLRHPPLTPSETVGAFLEAARRQHFKEARTYCTDDMAQAAIRAWMQGGFSYEVIEPMQDGPSSAEVEADITRGTQKFTLHFSLYNGDNRWLISLMRLER